MIQAADVQARLDAVVAAMRDSGAWNVAPPTQEAFSDMGAFGTRTMAFEQWLRYVFVANVEALIVAGGPWPTQSMVAVQAVREGDTNPAVGALVPALAAFDALFEPAATANELGWKLLAKADRTRSDLEEALAYFGIAIGRGVAVAVSNFGDALLALDRGDDAVEQLEKLSHGEDAVAARAQNWLGWYFTNHEPDPARAVRYLEQAAKNLPRWGVAWLNLAKVLDASGDIAGACGAYGKAVECEDSHDDTFARDRRLQLEMQLLARGVPPPAPPETARPDSAAFALVQHAAARLATAHAFMIRPTQRAGDRVMDAIIGTVVEGRALGHCVVGVHALTLAHEGDDLVFVESPDALLAWLAGLDPLALTPIDAALYLFDLYKTMGWWWEIDCARPASLVLWSPNLTDVRVFARAAGGVTVAIDDHPHEIATPARLLELTPALQSAIDEAGRRLRAFRMHEGETFRVLRAFGKLAVGEIATLFSDQYIPYDGVHIWTFHGDAGGRAVLHEDGDSTIVADIHHYLVRHG